jgi:hypothetical protein
MSIAGGCRCGAVRYTLALERLPNTYACHCRDCQTISGSAFAQIAPVLESAIAATGPIAIYEIEIEDRISRHRLCSVCHCRIFSTNTARPGLAAVRAGTLDESDQLDVVAHIWMKRKQPWIAIADGVPRWQEAAPPADFAAVLFAAKT